MAIAYFQTKNMDKAIEFTRKAIDYAPPAKENWLRLLSALYAQTEDYEKATPVLEELVLRYPKKDYWVQLSLIYAARDDYPVSLAVQQVAHRQGFLTEDKELMRLARSYIYHELPYPAAELLAAELDAGRVEGTTESYEMLANSWIASREYDRSLPALEKAAHLAEGGQFYVRLGQVYMQREQWPEAVANLQKALSKGELDKRGNAELLLGIALYNDVNVGGARNQFVRAREYEETREEADRWINHIERETQQEPQAG